MEGMIRLCRQTDLLQSVVLWPVVVDSNPATGIFPNITHTNTPIHLYTNRTLDY